MKNFHSLVILLLFQSFYSFGQCPVGTATPDIETLCSGGITNISLTSDISGTTFAWTVVQTNVTGASSDNGILIAQTLTTTGTIPGTAVYTITPTANSCDGTPMIVTITVNPQANAGTSGSTTVCDSSVAAIDLFSLITGEDPGGTWTRPTGTGGTFNALAGTFSPTAGATSSTFTYTVTGIPPCINKSSVATITINPLPNAGSDGNTSICDSSVAVIDLFSLISGEDTGGTWSRSTGTGGTLNAGTGTFTPAVGATSSTFIYTARGTVPCIDDTSIATVNISPQSNAGTSGSTSICESNVATINLFSLISGEDTGGTWTRTSGTGGTFNAAGATFIPTGANSSTFTYTITGAAPCTNASSIATVIINPQPNAGTDGNTTVCESSITPIDLFGLITGEQPGGSWTRTTGSGGTLNAVAGTFTPAPGVTTSTFTYTITATPPCLNSTSIATVTIKPTPTPTITNSNQTICSEATISTMVISSSVPSTTLNWTRDNTVSVTGIPNSGSGDISGSLTNTTNVLQTVTFTVTSTANGCNGIPVTATVSVKPKPNVSATNAAQTSCSGNVILPMNLTGTVAATTFNWIRDNTVTVTGIAASGTGNISGSLTNTTGASIIVTFTITPNFSGCDGTPIITTVLVKPKPLVTITNSGQTICSENSIATMVVSSSVPTTTLNWTRDNTVAVTGLPNSGSGDISGIMINGTNVLQTVTFTITSSVNGCNGLPVTATASVRPKPNVTATNPAQTLCSGGAITPMTLSGTIASTVFNWTRDNTVAVTGIAANGAGTISGTLTNTTNAPVTVTFTIIPTANGCPGAAVTTTVLVNPFPVITVQPVAPAPICAGISSTSISVTATGATTYQWQKNGVNLTNTPPYSTVTSATLNITNPAISENGASFTVVVGSAAGCNVTSNAVILSVNAPPTITSQPVSASTCTNGTVTFSVTASGVTTYQWKKGGVNLANGGIYGGVTTATLTITNPTIAENGASYTVTLNSATCPQTSNAAIITVNAPPVITVQPATPASVCTGSGTTSLTVTATGATTYQWKKGGVNLVNGAVYSGVNTATLTITNPPITENGASLTVVVGNATGCTVTSTARTLTVTGIPNPVIEFWEGHLDTTYTISACGQIAPAENDLDINSGNPGGSATLQWQVSYDNGATWVNAPGPTSTATQYVLDPLITIFESTAGVYKFKLIITNNGCSGTSNVITLTVTSSSNLTPGVIGSNQSSCGAATIDPAAFTVTTAPTGGVGNFTYQWQSSTDNITFNNIGGATAATYNAPSISQTTYYRRRVISDGCFAISNTLTVTILGPPTITSSSTGTICSAVAQNYVITSSLPSTYTWTRAAVVGISNIAGSGTTSPITEALVNTTNAPIVVRYVIIPKSIAGLCTGNAFNYDVTVTPSPKANIVGTQTICNNGSATCTITLTGTSPWNMTYFNGTASTTVNNINASPFVFTINNITTNTTYTVTALSDANCTAKPLDLTGSAVITVQNGTAGLWTGSVSMDWFDCRNWSGGLPSINTNVTIPSGVPNMPEIDPTKSAFAVLYGNIAQGQNLTIASGASLTMAAANNSELQIGGDWKNSGVFIPGTGTVNFNGATANQIQTINVGIKLQESFYNLTLNNSNGAKGVSVADGFQLTVSNNVSLLSGDLRLIGEAQLLQNGLTANPSTGSGKLLKDQQGTKSSWRYNYWSSPVSPDNSNYTVGGVLRDGTDAVTNPFNPSTIVFGNSVIFADGVATSPIRISSSWIYKYTAISTNYYSWQYIGDTGTVKVGEGYTMKGTDGLASFLNLQNYVFTGKPNNGTITLNISLSQSYLIGNPYPSAINADEFIKDNIKDGGRASSNAFNGALYFWDHFGGQTHLLHQYIGGYSTYTLMGGAVAIANDPLTINNNSTGIRVPGKYIPVGQGFFIDTNLDAALTTNNPGLSTPITGGPIVFKNTQRAFKAKAAGISIFFKSVNSTTSADDIDNRPKIRLKFDSPSGFHRQLLLGADNTTTALFDIGYDAPMIDMSDEDMYWELGDNKFVIQAISDFNVNQIVPFGLKVTNFGMSTIKIDTLENFPNDTQIYIHDNLTGGLHNLTNADFTISLPIGQYDNRFSLRFSNEALDVNQNDLNNGIKVFFTNNNDVLNIINHTLDTKASTVALFNLLGQSIATWDVENQDQLNIQIPIKNLSIGTYIVKIKTTQGIIRKKIIIQ